MRPIEISNFLKMTPQVPEYSSKNQNYLIAGANPLHYLSSNVQEEQVAPLAASIDWKQLSGTIEGSIVHMIPAVGGTATAYVITDTTHVYGINTSSVVTDMGYISGSLLNNTLGYLAIGGNFLFATCGQGGAVFYTPLTSTSWSSFGSIQNSVGVHFMEQFADHVALSDSSTTPQQQNLVKLIDPTSGTPSILSVPILNVGLGFGILKLKNYNDKYLAIAIGKGTSGSFISGYAQNYIYLWDGTLNSFNYSVKVPGRFIDMQVIDSVLYVAVQVSNGKTCIFYLKGTQLVKVFTTQYSTIPPLQPFSSAPCALFDFRSYLGIRLNNTTDLISPLLIHGSDEQGDLEFIHSSGRNFDQFVVDYNGILFANEYNGGNSNIWFLPTTNTFQTITYKSQWIPFQNLTGIDIFYDTPPASGTDAITVTLTSKGEDIITGTDTKVLPAITPTNNLNSQRTRLDTQGVGGDLQMIQIKTTNSTWRPVIRKIVLI